MKNIRLYSQYSEYEEATEYPELTYCEDTNLIISKKCDYSKEYFTIETLEDGMIFLDFNREVSYFDGEIIYKRSDAESWSHIFIGQLTLHDSIAVNKNEKIIFRHRGTCEFFKFGSTCKFIVYGNIMSLYSGESFENVTSFAENETSQFYGLFQDCDKLISAKNLILPATTLSYSCYQYMFARCASLLYTPTISSTVPSSGCYTQMFLDCVKIKEAIISADSSTVNCTYGMFLNCKSLNYVKLNVGGYALDAGEMFTGLKNSGTLYVPSSLYLYDNNFIKKFVGWDVFVGDTYYGKISNGYY